MESIRTTRLLAALGACGLALACAASPRVEVDAVESVDLASHRTFAVDTERLGADEPAWGPSARETARRVLEEALRARGLEAASDPATADLRVAVGVRSETRIETEYRDYATDHLRVERRRTGLRTPVGDVPLREETRVVHEPHRSIGPDERTIRSRAVIVEITETGADRLVWQGASHQRGYVTERIDLVDLERRLRAIAARWP